MVECEEWIPHNNKRIRREEKLSLPGIWIGKLGKNGTIARCSTEVSSLAPGGLNFATFSRHSHRKIHLHTFPKILHNFLPRRYKTAYVTRNVCYHKRIWVTNPNVPDKKNKNTKLTLGLQDVCSSFLLTHHKENKTWHHFTF